MSTRASSRSAVLGILLFVAAAAAGCGPAEREEAETGVEEATPGLRAPTGTAGTDQRLLEHMQHMEAAPPDSLVHLVPMHLEEVGAILDELEPMSLGMQSDAVWRSTVDSVQNDLAHMRDLSGEELRAFMPEHVRRMERLVLLHDSAMGSER